MKRRDMMKAILGGVGALALAKVSTKDESVDAAVPSGNVTAIKQDITSGSSNFLIDHPLEMKGSIAQTYGVYINAPSQAQKPVMIVPNPDVEARKKTGIFLGQGFDAGIDVNGNSIVNAKSLTIGDTTLNEDDLKILLYSIKNPNYIYGQKYPSDVWTEKIVSKDGIQNRTVSYDDGSIRDYILRGDGSFNVNGKIRPAEEFKDYILNGK